MMDNTQTILDWLMAGDLAIRWQTQRDLLGASEAEWRAEKRRTLEAGWGAQLLAHQDPDGTWGGGLYSPKWISTTYTLLALLHIGVPPDCAAAQRGAKRVLDGMLGETCDSAFARKLADLDRCIVGMILQLAVYFEIDDARIPALVDNLLQEVMPDGGWNCRKGRKMSNRPAPHHSSFHTTFNVLDGLREYVERRDSARQREVRAAEQAALELLLQHRLVYSDHTGQVIHPAFTRLAYPYRWHYSLLRGLEYFARSGASRDERLQDGINLLVSRRTEAGLWRLEHEYAAKVYFRMERVGKPSRWVTLRSLRVLKWWER
jgi:transposase